MRRVSTRLVLVVALAVVTPVAAAGPELSVATTCDSTPIAAGATVTVPVVFRAGTSDAGSPNAVSAADFAVTFAADVFDVGDVRLPAGLASSGNWTLAWERTLGQPEVPGRVGILVAPELVTPVPTLPDAAIVELLLVARADAPDRCVAIEIPIDSVVLSTPPLGHAIAPGRVTSGGVAITTTVAELCRDCADNDGDDLIDLADPDCGAGALTFTGKRERIAVKDGTDSDAVIDLRGTLDAAFDDVTGPLRLDLRLEGGVQPACHVVEAAIAKRKGSRHTRAYLFTDASEALVAKLISDLDDGRSTLAVKLHGLALPEASALSVSLWLGNVPFHARVPFEKTTHQGHVYRQAEE